MAQSIKIQMYPRERLDLPDYQRLQDFTEDDFQLQNVHLLGGGATSWITKGFRVSAGAGLTVDITIANSALFNVADSTSDLGGTFYIADGSLPVSESVALADGTDNYIHVRINRATSSTAQRVFWDPTLNDGEGGEYLEFVDTAEIKEYEFIVSSSWSTDDRDIPIARVRTAGATVVEIADARNMFFRLGKGEGYSAGYVGSITYVGVGPDDMAVTGVYTDTVSRTYVVEIDGNGTPDTFRWSKDGGATWEATTVPLSSIYTLLENGIYVNWVATTGHTIGDSWSFGATANAGESYRFRFVSPTVPASDDFLGGDKELGDLKEWMDAIMSAIHEIKFGEDTNNAWYEAAPSNLSSSGVVMTGGGDISWDGTSVTFTEDFTFAIPGYPYINTVSFAAHSPLVLNDGYLYWVTIDKTSSASLTPTSNKIEDYEPVTDSMIMMRRLGNILYVGNGSLQLGPGESGKLIRPLTNETLTFVGAMTGATPDASLSAPDYATYGGNPVHYINNNDDLAVAIAKLGYAFTSRFGDTLSGAFVFDTSSGACSLTFATGVTSLYQSGSTTTFSGTTEFTTRPTFSSGGAPMTVTSTTKVTNLNADLLDGYTSGNGSGNIPISNGTVCTNLNAQYVGGGANTGHGGGINADMVDGYHASSFSLSTNSGTAWYQATSNGSWVVPTGISRITIQYSGGGGGGGGSGNGANSWGGGGGGSAPRYRVTRTVSGGDTISFTIGSGGAGGAGNRGSSAVDGANGTTTYVYHNGVLIGSGSGGQGGYSGDATTYKGRGGSYGGASSGRQDDGGGGADAGGSGGGHYGGYGGAADDSGALTPDQRNGGAASLGSGGGGGGNGGSAGGGNGGNGGDGYIEIYY